MTEEEPRLDNAARRRFLLSTVGTFALLLAIVLYVGRVAQQLPLGVDLDRRSIDRLPTALSHLLADADRHLSLTYFTSHRRDMPSRFKGVEEKVRRFLESVRRAAPSRVEYRVIDPAVSGVAAIGYAASKKVSPVSVRQVKRDEYDEQSIWSSLVVSYEGSPEFLIGDIETADVPHLAGLLAAHLQTLHQPISPAFAFSAPAGFEQFPRYLSQHGPVVEIDLDRSPRHLPDDVDILFWFEPATVTHDHVRTLERFIASGRSVVLAGSSYHISYSTAADSDVVYHAHLSGDSWAELLRPFGLAPIPDLLLDGNTGPASALFDDGVRRQLETPFHLRNLPAFRDFRKFRTPSRGGLSFVAASPLQVDPERVVAAGFISHIVGTTTERVRVATLPEKPFRDSDLSPVGVAKQNLMVLLSSPSKWSGDLLVLASASMFADDAIEQPGYGHSLFVADLVRSFADRESLLRGRVDRREPAPVPPLSTAARVFWRGIVVFLVPALVLIVGVWRLARVARTGIRWDKLRPGLQRTLTSTAALLLLLTSGVLGLASVDIDLTREKASRLAADTVRLLRAQAGLRVELIVSPKALMPGTLKDLERRLVSLLRQADLDVAVRYADHLSPERQRQLHSLGLTPFEAESIAQDTVVISEVWSGLLLSRGQATAVVPRVDNRSIRHLDFLLAAALQRLDGDVPVVSVVSDLPRLSPAEALEDYQKKGLSAPHGVDVYGRAKHLLERYGYEVAHIDPRAPRLNLASSAVLWLQPRKDSTPVILQLAEYLAGGGHAVVALQHFNIQQRQYRGIGFQTVYWPQPQFQDFDRYLRLFGVEEVREVLMDRTRSSLRLDTQVNRTAVREYDPQQVALPFLIRAVGAHYAAASPVTRNLGDLLFIWGNRFSLDQGLLNKAGLSAEILVETSSLAWEYPWKAGFLKPDDFEPTAYLSERQPLALRLSGLFPAAKLVEDVEGRSSLVVEWPEATEAGSLTLIGCSEMFKNDHLTRAGFDHEQLLLNAVATAALDRQLAILQSRHARPQGFAFIEPEEKLWWRLMVIGVSPAVVVLAGLVRWQRRTAS